ncbi:hypothetical protein pb186bvf_003539 [Paramecium bursaria]
MSKNIEFKNMSVPIQFMASQSWSELKRRPCGYCVSFMSVMVVVAASAVSQSIIDRAPLIFLMSAEGPAGQQDVVLERSYNYMGNENIKSPYYLKSQYSTSERGTYYNLVNFLNFTRISDVLGQQRASLSSPRIRQKVNITNLFMGSAECQNFTSLLQTLFTKYDLNSQERYDQIYDSQTFALRCTQNSRQIEFAAIDTAREKELRLGWDYPFEPLGENEAVISKKIAFDLNLTVGDVFYINANFYDFYADYFITYNFSSIGGQYNVTNYDSDFYAKKFDFIKQAATRFYPYKIKGIIDSTYGKFANSLSDKLVITEYKHFIKNIAYFSWREQYLTEMYDADPNEYADEIQINLQNRYDVYMSSNYETIQGQVTKFAANLNKDVGVYPVDMYLPVLEELNNTQYGQMFLGIILSMIIVILFLLSVILLYTLLLITVETKTYDLGVLRVLGFNKLGVVLLVITQALSYVIPAIIAGLTLSFPLLVYAVSALKASIGVEFAPVPTGNALALSICLGLLIPLASSIIPIREALKQQLSFALDLQRSKSSAVKINIDLSGTQIPWGFIQFGLIASIFGICVYYFLPLALLSLNIGLLLSIFFFILCGMLLGLVLLAFNIQYLMERLCVWIFLFWAGGAKRSMVIKNLAAHRIKNRRTALMYSLSIAFVIFIYVGMSVQIGNQQTQTVQKHGCYLEITRKSGGILPIFEFENIINDLNQDKEQISDYAWVTIPLETYMQHQGYQSVFITNLGQVFQYQSSIYGVSPSIFDLGFNRFLKVEQSQKSDLNPVQQLYTAKGSQSVIMGTSIAEALNLNTNEDQSFLIVVYNNTYTQYHQMRVSSILTTAPAFKFSSLKSQVKQDMLVSLPTYKRLTGNESLVHIQNTYGIIKVGTWSRRRQRPFSTYIQQNNIGASIWDYRDYEKSIQQSQDLIIIIFNALTIVVMFLCFFSLMTSMSANMLEQVKEIAVLRSIGNSKLSIQFVYTAESFVLVLSSSIMGLMIGFIVGQSMAVQQTLFTQLPLVFVFPWSILLVIIFVSVIAGIISVLVPSRQILKNEIAQIMRMN